MTTILKVANRSLSYCLSSITPISSILLTTMLMVVTSQTAWAASYTVCQLPASCDFVSPEAAVNDPLIADGDTIDIVSDTYVLGATLQVNNSITILANDSVFEANGIRAISVFNAATNFSLTNVTIRNGGQDDGFGGGALRVSGGATVTVIGGFFENNQAEFGGAIHNDASTVNIRESVFTGNEATAGEGGAVLTVNGGITNLTRTTIDGNSASVAGGGLAVADNASQLNFIASTISNNAVLAPSQTVSNLAVGVSIISCGNGPLGQTFTADASALSAFEFDIRLNGPSGDLGVIPNDLNILGQVRQGGPGGPIIATAHAFAPGGVWPGSSTQVLTFRLDRTVALIPNDIYAIESFISGSYNVFQSAGNDYAGGERYSCDGTLIPGNDLTFRTFGGNPGPGGGIHVSSSASADLFNSTLSGNVGDGAMATSGGILTTLFSTITANSGNGLTAITPGLVFITASITAANDGNDCDGNTTSSGHNLIGDDSNCIFTPTTGDLYGTGNAPLDPLLGPLQVNGGHTATHAIDQNSPAFDAAGTGPILPCLDAPEDQRGVTRPDGPACDIGSFELQLTGPFQSLIDVAPPGTTIIIPDGIYTELITIGDGKTLRASNPGAATIDASAYAESAITATGDFTLEGIRVTGGNSPGNGGGLIALAAGTDINLIDVVFDNNDAALDGGAVYIANGTLTATGSTFTNNNAGGNGGAIFSGGSATISNTVFRLNHSDINGGAIATAGPLISSNNEFDRNDADNGGAIFSNGNTVITGSVFAGNSAVEGDGVSGQGGAVFNDGILSLINSTIADSSAGAGGGLYNNSNGSVSISGTTFRNNNADGPGTVGGAIGGAGTIEITNSTLSGNTSLGGGGNGGGIGLLAGIARLNNVTLAFNAASGLGGSFYAEAGALISLSNSLLSDNTGGATNCSSLQSLGYNLFQNASCQTAASDINAEPMIDILAANGGPTQTHALQDLSPAINAGHPVSAFPQFDAANFGLLQSQGATTLDAGALYLAGGSQTVGSAFVANPIDPTLDFSAKFQFLITPGTGGAADGFTFTVSDDPTVLGQGGGLLGIAVYDPAEPSGVRSVVNGVSVEFDTWINGVAEGANDQFAEDHIGINFNGSLSSTAITWFGSHGVLSDGNVWTAWIDYDAGAQLLEVRAASNETRPALPLVSAPADIASLTGTTAFVGFTGATAGNNVSGEHRILNFSFANSCQPDDQRGDSRPKSSACDIGAFEAPAIPLQMGPVVLSTESQDQELTDGTSYPGVVSIPIIDIPIEKLTGDTFNAPESSPLGSFPIGSFPIGSFSLQSSPIGSFPLGSFPIGSFPIGSFPLGSFSLASIPLLDDGGWSAILDDIPELAGAPLQTVTLERVLKLNPLPDSVANIVLRDLYIRGSALASLSLPGLSLGDTTVAELDQWALNAGQAGTDGICVTLNIEDPDFTDCREDDTLMGLEIRGAPVSALSLSSLPLGSFPIGSFPIGSFPIGSFPLGSFPIGSFPIGSFPIGSFPIGSFPLGSFPIGSFPLSSFNLLAAPIGSFPLGSFPLGSFPLGSFEIDGRSFCDFYDEQAIASGEKTCVQLDINPAADSLAELVAALQVDNPTGNIGSTPLGSFPMGSFPIGSFPIGSFDLDTLASAPLSLLILDDFDGCQAIDGTADCSSIDSLTGTSSLVDVATEYGTLAASPIGSFPIGSFDVASLPMGSFPIGSFEVNGAPLGSFPLGSFDLIGSPLGSFPLGSFPIGSFEKIIDDPDGLCAECKTLADAARAGVISSSATLADLSGSPEFASTTFGVVLDAMTLAILYGPGTLADIEDTGNLTLGQLLIAMMLKTDFPWETIPLNQLDSQQYSADNFVTYALDIPLTGTETESFLAEIKLQNTFMYVEGSSLLDTQTPLEGNTSTPIDDPVIVDNGDGTQTLAFNLFLGGFSNNTISFSAVPALTLGEYPASATVAPGSNGTVVADNSSATVTVIPDPLSDISEPGLALTTPANVLSLGFINTPDDTDYFLVAPPAAGDRVAVFMSNPAGDNDLIMYEPYSSVEEKGQDAESRPLNSVPIEDDGVDYQGNLSEEPNALGIVNLAEVPLASISTNSGTLDEMVSAIAESDEPFTIQVFGYNGAVSDDPYTLRVKVTPEVSSPLCTARGWPGSAGSTVLPAGSWMPDTNAVFLVNGARLAASDPDGQAGADAALTAINQLINAPGVSNGVVVDVADIFGVDYSAWDNNPCDVDAPNAIVNAITKYLEEKRLVSPNLLYVTIVGSDEVIPFARKPDETSIANESTFAGEFSDNAMHGALVTRHFLSDDSYGDIDPIPWLGRYLNVPELGVGRLLESAEDIRTAAENYIASGGILDPRTALSAGYDFVADAAEDIDDTFNDYGPTLGFNVEPALIDQADVLAELAWTKANFLGATGVSPSAPGNPLNPVDQVSFNMHFDFDEALPSSGDAAGNYTDNLISTGDLAGADLTGGIWFTVGCHSGTNVADVSVVAGAPSQDWAQTFSHLGALYLAQNAFGLGDTEALALTERLMAYFARNLTGSLSIGQAHAFAKQQYFADLGLYGEYDYKAMQAATLFGLPMYKYGNGAIVTEPLPPILPISTDPFSGLASATWSLPDTGITEETDTSKGSVFSVDGDVQFVHFRPLQPIVRRDVTSPGSLVASGAFLTALTTEDIFVSDIAFARPVIDLGENEPEIETDEVVFPTTFTNIANYKAPPVGGGLFERRDQLNVIVGQFTSLKDGASHGNERLFRSLKAQIFYRPALPASPAPEDDFLGPEFNRVQASVVGSSAARQASFSVDVTDDSEVLRVAVLYMKSVTGNPSMGNWVLVDLVRSAGGSKWTGSGPVDLSGIVNGQVDYMVQAVDSHGNVANSTFKGLFNIADTVPPAPDGTDPDDPFVVILTDPNDPSTPLDNDIWINVDSVKVNVDVSGDVSYEYSIDGSYPLLPLTSNGFVISGDGVHIVRLYGSDGSEATFVVLIDNTPAEIIIATPANGEYVVQGSAPAADYICRDPGSGVASCSGEVAMGSPIPDDVTGTRTFTVNAIDNTGLESSAANTWYNVQQLEISGPVGPQPIDTAISITARATDLEDIDEYMTIDWGDGTLSSSASPQADVVIQNGDLFTADHLYVQPGLYTITVTVDYDAGVHTQTDVFEYAVVYDSQGGFVTGGGWINSPPGAYTPNDLADPEIAGRANFNFTSKYKKGGPLPGGSTNFRFAAGDLVFNSSAYDWMFITGALVRYKGVGTVKGSSGLYKFQITAIDANVARTEVSRDGFRIKIWQEDNDYGEIVLYDSGLGADDANGSGGTTQLGGGSVQVHKTGKK